MAQQFSGIIYKIGINPCVDVPPRVSRAFDKRGYIPVAGALNGGPVFKFNEAISFQVSCKSQKEVDYYWEKLSAGGIRRPNSAAG